MLVMHLNVRLQRVRLDKPAIANRTRERFLAGVPHHVVDHRLLLAERQSAMRADVRLQSLVHADFVPMQAI